MLDFGTVSRVFENFSKGHPVVLKYNIKMKYCIDFIDLIRHKIIVFDEVNILLHFNIIILEDRNAVLIISILEYICNLLING